jgi:AcrR family transcriptional regulator
VAVSVNPRATVRQEQAALTRRRIADAAQRLFAAHGYAATSVQAIAREAGVGDRTVYAVYGSKRELLSAICERWLERARAREVAVEVLAIADPVARLRGAARWLTNLYSTDFDVVRILDAALDEDPATRELLRAKLRGRTRVMDRLIASAEDALHVPLDEAQAIFRGYAASGVYGELVVESGWPVQRFETWLADALAHQLAGH